TWAEQGNYTIQAKAKNTVGIETDWITLEISMPKSKATNSPFIMFLENHPRLFPLIRQILGL
ncbi:MAG: Zn-dependent exopeptidase M28, partial [Thermoplasmatales archaeon]|nr:Zn-dependent exopeptidase M28 [Thermoplasmatales archaeon]